MPLVLLALAATVAILYAIIAVIKPDNYPPGPVWLPFVGCSRTVAQACDKHGSQHKAFSELAKQYSCRVLGLKLGKELVVVVHGTENVSQVLTREHFEGRPTNYFMKLRCLGKQIGITAADGALWREHRQFAVRHLKHLGFGKRLMEAEIAEELDHFYELLKANPKEVNLRDILAPAIMNVLWKFAAGQCIRDDRRLKALLELLGRRSKAFSMSGGWLNRLPWLRFVAPVASGYSLIRDINRDLMEIITDAIEKHESGAVDGEDFMYAFLKEIRAGKDTYTRKQLSIVCLDLLIAGSQTTSNSLEFAFLMALRNQDVQDKIFDEISNAVGNNAPCWYDHTRLPFTMSFLLEVQRYFTVVPLIGPRRALEDSTIAGYFIPKNTTILLSIHDLHHSPEAWIEPEQFIPERFIDSNGELKATEHLYHFGRGRRRCPGDSLAKRFIFLIFVGILQKYKIECSNGTPPTCEPVCGIVMAPVQFTANFSLRSKHSVPNF